MHPLTHPVEPHFVHLSWAVRRLTPTQSRYIKTFYGGEVLHHLEQLEHRQPRGAHHRPLPAAVDQGTVKIPDCFA